MKPRVAIVFDNSVRPETTGTYVRRALGEVAEVEHLLPTDLGRSRTDASDLILAVDEGLSYRFPFNLHPLALWAIDTHLDFERLLKQAEQARFVFCAQWDGVEKFRQAGIDNAVWLPLACDPELHGQQSVEKQFDVAFVGNSFPGPRHDLLELIRREFPNTFVGQRYYEEMARTYSAARIVFNRSVANDVNMRVFEALASGSLLVTNDLTENGQAELFRDGEHLVTYRTAEELIDKLRFYLIHDEARERIARRGREEVLAKHTYRHRVEAILNHVATRRSLAFVPSTVEREPSEKECSYYQFARPELVALVPASARRVLDIGCGAGFLGAALKQRQPVEVWGVERDGQTAAGANMRLDRVVCGDAETLNGELPTGHFDCIVLGDILEHLRRPNQLLERARTWLSEGGCLVASLPNVRHHSVVAGLLEGNWTYEAAGLLDDDHLRFFTRREIEKLFFRAGFDITAREVVPGPGYAEWQAAGRPGCVQVGGLCITGLVPEDAEEFYVYQYLLKAERTPHREYGFTSIIVPTHNGLDYTRQCLESIRRLTDEPYELIVVDNGSTDGTVAYLESLDGIRLIRNSENRGFPAAINQGIAAARGCHLLLLNNDTIVTTGWLRRMLDVLHSNPQIGLVGPVSNCVSGEQQVETNYRDLSQLDGLAWDWSRTHRGVMRITDRLVGFCLLLKRDVLDQIGGLDERFGLGCFDDDDLCRRALAAGFQAVIADEVFIHHFGGVTFRALGVDFGQVMEENRQRYEQKWADPTPVAKLPDSTAMNAPQFSLEADPEGGLLLRRKKIRLSLCMIVRDNEHTIRAALEGIRPWVDEMIVVDTGSLDRTPEICRELGARVYRFPWCDDFSAARNESLKHAVGEWIFWMDSDDTISEHCGRKLRELADGVHDPQVLGYILQVHCPGPPDEGPPDCTVVDHVKLIRNRPDLRFEGRIHEQLLPAIRRAAGEVGWTDLYVVHSGSDHSLAGRQQKLERDLRILLQELRERPKHPFVLFNLGMTHADAKQHDDAIRFLRRCLAVSTPDESHVRKAYALLISSLAQAERDDEAWQFCEEGLRLFPDDKELLFRSAMLHHHFGRLEAAVQTYLRVLREPESRHFTSVDVGLAGHKARHNLALVYEDLGRSNDAEQEWCRILDELPDYRPAARALGEQLLRLQRYDDLQRTTAEMRSRPALRVEAALLDAKRDEAQGHFGLARDTLETTVREAPHDRTALHELCRFLFERVDPLEAEAPLSRLLELDPEDAAALHNFGTLLLRKGLPDSAASSLSRSLELRPRSPATRQLLQQALEACGSPHADGMNPTHRFNKWPVVNAGSEKSTEVIH